MHFRFKMLKLNTYVRLPYSTSTVMGSKSKPFLTKPNTHKSDAFCSSGTLHGSRACVACLKNGLFFGMFHGAITSSELCEIGPVRSWTGAD